MLSNGEYVINEKSAKALGYETLDQLNHYADGGVLNPTPYVPTLNQKVVDSTLRNYGSGNNGGLYRQNGTSIALMEKQNKMMAEQNDMLKNANGQQGGGQVIVLNTHASSDDVMRALQENPRALQAILGRQNRMGFR
jgi:predicted acylesterase/phospholipase RssA